MTPQREPAFISILTSRHVYTLAAVQAFPT